PNRAATGPPADRGRHRLLMARPGHGRGTLAGRADLAFAQAGVNRPLGPGLKGGSTVVTCMIILYTAIVIVLFKLKLLKPRAFPIAWTVVAGVLIIGVIVVGWTLCAPMSPRVVTTQYVIQLVPYVKGQVTKVAAKAN